MDDTILSYLAEVDEIWHAGDIGDANVMERLEAAKPVRAVFGNIDDTNIRQRYPEDLFFEVEGLSVFMTHIGGYPGRYNVRARQLIDAHRPGLFICGHSHILKVMPDAKRNLLHINPGACGQHGFQLMRTLIRFSIHNGRVDALEVVN
ncbi:MAG: metallophosphoesterase family protein [Saprospiraceae bacterium]